MTGWIACEDRLPEAEGPVNAGDDAWTESAFVLAHTHRIGNAYAFRVVQLIREGDRADRWYDRDGGGSWPFGDMTHWRPLPPPPEPEGRP